MPQILFICTGNLCRSPAAEVLLKHQLAQKGLGDWDVGSAGTWAVNGRPATNYMIQLMAECGLDLSAHRSRAVNRRIIEQADLVLTMTRDHAEALSLEFQDQAANIHLLSEMQDDRRYDIKDPYSGTMAEYRVCVNEIQDLLKGGLSRIRSLVEQNVP